MNNILNDLTIKNLKLNKKRTIVTIIGILLSTSLICAVAGMISSFQGTAKSMAIIEEGNRHLTVESIKQSDLKYFENNRNIKSMYVVDNLGYALLDGSKNVAKPYLYIKAYTKNAFDNTTIKLVSGRLPQNESELVISESVIKNGEVPLKVGDKLNLQMGKRVCSDNSELNQNNPKYIEAYDTEDTCHEKFIVTGTKNYEIVGIMERPSFSIEDYHAPGFTAITYTNTLTTNDIDVSMLFKDPKYYKEFKSNLQNSEELHEYNIDLNSNLLRFEGASITDNAMQMLLTVAAVVIGIIIVTSIFVIKNSFDISIVEKTKQYGMLSSIGATSKQIRKNVLYEGLILGIIGIPIGILCGIFADFVLVQVINIFGTDLFNDIKFIFSVPLLPILLSAVLASITIYLSVIKSARKASKISPIVAIRNNNEIKISNKKLKTPKIINSLFGIGGNIAYKNLKRSKKKYRTTVISIVVSVAVFISLSAFLNYGFKITSGYYTDYGYNLMFRMDSEDINSQKEVYNKVNSLDNIEKTAFHRYEVLDLNMLDYVSSEAKKEWVVDNEGSAFLVSLGDEEYKRFIKSIGLNYNNTYDKAILIDDCRMYDSDEEKYKTINFYDYNKVKNIKGKIKESDFEINVIKRTEEKPMGLEKSFAYGGYLIVSDELMNKIFTNNLGSEVYIKTSDAETLETSIKNYLQQETNITDYNITNIDKIAKSERQLIILVSIFLYGFIIVISLIGITNIFNTLTTNMNLRKKEFAMLKSIGMTKSEFNKMIRLESLMYGTKSLLIGIPLGLIGAYFIYKAFASGEDMNYLIPYQAIIISIVVVYLLVSLIMHFSLKKTSKQNIIETIRNDNI